MSVFVGDALAEAGVLDATETGAYWRLEYNCWLAGGALPLDPKRLARLAGIDFSAWEGTWAVIGRYFDLDGDVVRHPRVTREMARAREMQDARRRGAEKTNAQRYAGRHAKRALSEAEVSRSNTGIPSPSPSPSPGLSPEGEGDAPAAPPPPASPFLEFFDRAQAGNNGPGLRAEAAAEWEEQGRPAIEVIERQWAAYLASVPTDGRAKVMSSWLRGRGWEQRWPKAKKSEADRGYGKIGAVVLPLAEAPKRCGFHSLPNTGGTVAPAYDPRCIGCMRAGPATDEVAR